MIKLIASDMDGTLLDCDGRLPKDFFEVLERLKNNNVKFAVASGRSYYTLYNNFSQNPEGIIYIADNGTYVAYLGEVIYKSILKKEFINKIINVANKIEGVHIILCGTSGAYVKPYSKEFAQDIEKYYKDRIVKENLLDIEDDILKVAVCDKRGSQTNSYPILSSEFKEDLNVVVSGSDWVDLMNKDANKGRALNIIQQRFKILPKETMTFGDYYNDVEMLKASKYSFVMQNSNEDMKKYGKFVAKSNKEQGVIKAIKEYVFKERY